MTMDAVQAPADTAGIAAINALEVQIVAADDVADELLWSKPPRWSRSWRRG